MEQLENVLSKCDGDPALLERPETIDRRVGALARQPGAGGKVSAIGSSRSGSGMSARRGGAAGFLSGGTNR
jgi:hypothetical protein